MNGIHKFIFSLLLVLFLPVLVLGGCVGPSYYAQAISGHLRLMRSRQDLAVVIADPDTPPELANRLESAQQILTFAHEKLDLTGDGNFTQVVITGQEAITWNVIAAPEFSVDPKRWCFPVAGCVPYRGYFRHSQADIFAAKLKHQSLDVSISPAVAYSTLGWFDDPLLDTMLKYSDTQLAGIMFHELAHERLYLKSDTGFSEAFASFVEETGVRLWLEETNQDVQLVAWENRKKANMQFNQFLLSFRERLELLYASELSDETKRRDKSQLLETMKNEYRDMMTTHWSGVDYFAHWMSGNLNNASLALVNSYEGGSCAFTLLFEEAGKQIEPFYRLAEEKADLQAPARKAWLEDSCDGIASAGKL